MMRSRTTYTADQASAVMRLLRHRLGAKRSVQKADRDELRSRYGFWISEFWSGFTDSDFKKKVEEGILRITGA
jgi:hypothetical protein